jgi:hypothetical protein
MANPFLSEAWLTEARRLRAEYEGQVTPVADAVRMNLVINEVPFGTGLIDAHLSTASGEIELDLGHLDSPDLTVTVDYPTARAILVDGDSRAAMQAFMEGKVRVVGDIAKLMALQAVPVDGSARELAGRLRDITQ